MSTVPIVFAACAWVLAGCGPSSSTGPDSGDDDAPCVNLECQQAQCPSGATTRLLGRIYAPTPVDPDPLPNVTVYVPNAAVEPFGAGVTCTTCNSPLSGAPLVKATTAVDGTFALTDMPSGPDIPIVIQTGRWRRQVTMSITPCTDNLLPPPLARLPRNRTEGDIPRMAIATGQLDSLECTLAKMIDPAELGPPGSDARIHMYRLNGNDLATPVPSRATMLANLSTLLAYDTVLLPCPSSENFLAPETENLKAYADQGGRLYLTHHGGDWMDQHGVKYPSLVQFNRQPDPAVDRGAVHTTFEKGKLFADWLQAVGATTAYGVIPISSAQWHVDSTMLPAQTWVSTASPTTVQHLTFNTPVTAEPANQCGRVLYSNFHVAPGSIGIYPAACTTGALTPQEKLVEFMLFDLTACIAPDVIL
jgi:hypothetical protein